MPVRGKTRNDPPMKKLETASGIFRNHGGDGHNPEGRSNGSTHNVALLKDALAVHPRAKIGGKKTLTR